jgi:hypothetical protein
MRSAETPRFSSRAMSASMEACDSRMPASSGTREMSFILMSYQARIS